MKRLIMTTLATLASATALYAADPVTYTASEDDLPYLNALYNAVSDETISESLIPQVTTVSAVNYGASEEGTQYWIALSRCGFTGCSRWKDLLITEIQSIADAPATFESELVDPRPLPFHPVNPDLLKLATSFITYAECGRTLRAVAPILSQALVTTSSESNETQTTYGWMVSTLGAWEPSRSWSVNINSRNPACSPIVEF
jgi:hypothetical protein